MKNKLTDLNNHLFAQLERLSEDNLDAEQIEKEVDRAKAITKVSNQIIGAAALQFKAAELVAKHGRGVSDMIPDSMSGRMIEYRKTEAPATALQAPNQTEEDRERREAEARRLERETREEREERRRQDAEEKAGK